MNIAHKTRRTRDKGLLLVLGFLTAVVMALPAQANNIEAGKATAQSCVMCHGAIGLSQMPSAPNLAGQPAIYVAEQLRSFRSGKRENQIMNVIAKPLSDDEISNLAAWYESIQIEARLR